jgi:hypothetical protein
MVPLFTEMVASRRDPNTKGWPDLSPLGVTWTTQVRGVHPLPLHGGRRLANNASVAVWCRRGALVDAGRRYGGLSSLLREHPKIWIWFAHVYVIFFPYEINHRVHHRLPLRVTYGFGTLKAFGDCLSRVG